MSGVPRVRPSRSTLLSMAVSHVWTTGDPGDHAVTGQAYKTSLQDKRARQAYKKEPTRTSLKKKPTRQLLSPQNKPTKQGYKTGLKNKPTKQGYKTGLHNKPTKQGYRASLQLWGTDGD